MFLGSRWKEEELLVGFGLKLMILFFVWVVYVFVVCRLLVLEVGELEGIVNE